MSAYIRELFSIMCQIETHIITIFFQVKKQVNISILHSTI